MNIDIRSMKLKHSADTVMRLALYTKKELPELENEQEYHALMLHLNQANHSFLRLAEKIGRRTYNGHIKSAVRKNGI